MTIGIYAFHHEDFVSVANDTTVSVAISVGVLFRSEVDGLVVVVVEFHREPASTCEVSWIGSSLSRGCWKVDGL